MLSWPRLRSNRLRGAMRGGLWSSFSVPGAGIETSEEWYWDGAQRVSGLVSVGRCVPHSSPDCICSSPVRPVRSMGVVVFAANGTWPATKPESKRQLKLAHMPSFLCWYCRFVVWLNFSSWSMRNGAPELFVAPRPPICAGKNRAETDDITLNALNPWRLGTEVRMAKPVIFELCHSIGKVMGVAPRT